jgi:xylan 1,4-beta-xylosidase
MRDPSIRLAPDGCYYLTGATGGSPTWWTHNEGIELWRSPDLNRWESLGRVWSIGDGTWQQQHVTLPEGDQPLRTVWAPEVHHINGTFWLAYCMPGHGSSLLRSSSGTAAGPYEDVHPDGPLVPDHVDASLFEDDDGSVWFVWQSGSIARLNHEMTALESDPFQIKPADHQHVGFEGAFLLKHDGLYHLFAAEFQRPGRAPLMSRPPHTAATGLQREGIDDPVELHDKVGFYYSCMSASATDVHGPWSERYLVAEHAGHNTVFRDNTGNWCSTIFGNDPCAPIREQPGILELAIGDDDRWHPVV